MTAVGTSNPRRFSSLKDRLWGQPSLITNGITGALISAVKRPGHEANHFSPITLLGMVLA
jgi:hypothetical protein